MQDIAFCVEKAKVGLAAACIIWEDAVEELAAKLTEAVSALPLLGKRLAHTSEHQMLK